MEQLYLNLFNEGYGADLPCCYAQHTNSLRAAIMSLKTKTNAIQKVIEPNTRHYPQLESDFVRYHSFGAIFKQIHFGLMLKLAK